MLKRNDLPAQALKPADVLVTYASQSFLPKADKTEYWCEPQTCTPNRTLSACVWTCARLTCLRMRDG